MRTAVTTVLSPGPRAAEAAARAAARHGLPFLPRGDRSLPSLAAEEGADALVVLGSSSGLWMGGRESRWSPGMGALRAKRLAIGDRTTRDPFLEAAGLLPSETVLDCTAGLGADALVAAGAVGPGGRVVALDSSAALAAWVDEGLRRLADPAARRIELRCEDHAAFLDRCAERSFDAVVFDPMFRHARPQAPGFDPVRRLADPRPLEARAVARARRVARRCVLVKDGSPGWDLARLGLPPLPSRRGAHRLYARLDPLP